MKVFGVILAIIMMLGYIALYALGIILLKKNKHWTALKAYLYRFAYSILFVFIGFLPIKLMTGEDISFDIKLPWLMIFLMIPYVYDFIFLKNIKESITPYLELDKESDEYDSLNKSYHIESINGWFEGSKSNIYTMCFFSALFYAVVYLFFYGFIEAIVRL